MALPSSTSRLKLAPRQRRAGFALLLTITLLAFIVILLIGLATYTRIDVAIAGNNQRQAQARQNALMGLNIAVAQLQKYAGPDARVTATPGTSDGTAGQYYTGVWDGNTTGTAPLMWLVSGSEIINPNPPDPQALLSAALPPAGTATATQAFLVGNYTVGANPISLNATEAARRVKLPTLPITAPGVPGQTGNGTVIGRYAWWVGDNGVKADVARGDVTASLNYPPFATTAVAATDTAAAIDAASIPEMRARLFQQTAQGAGPFALATSVSAFEPRDSVNTTLALNTVAAQQIPFLRNVTGSGNTAVGLNAFKTHFHNWTVGNFNVLARTNAPSGSPSLRTDLSIHPESLGTTFAAWANYPSYMEAPDSLNLATPPVSSMRRRYKMTPAVTDDSGARFGVSPVLTYFALTFSFHNLASSTITLNDHLEGSMRCVAEFWNPYTSSLVPEDLEIRITGVPTVGIGDFDPTTPRVSIDVQSKFGDASAVDPNDPNALPPIRFSLPWASAPAPDDQTGSWLPGRVYSWSAVDNAAPSANGTNLMEFGVRNLDPDGTAANSGTGAGVARDLGLPLATVVAGTTSPQRRRAVTTAPTVLTIELRRASDGVVLTTFQSPSYPRFSTDDTVFVSTTSRALDFAYVFRMADPVIDAVPWVQIRGMDVRMGNVSTVSPYLPADNTVDPAAYVVDSSTTPLTTKTTLDLGNASLLLDRDPGTSTVPTGTQFDEDVPVFELPRSPLLSLGQLQHLSIPSLRPFWVGNSNAGSGPTAWNNSLFDQYFFSGLGSGSTWTDTTAPLPNTLAKVLRHKPDGTSVSVSDFIQVVAPPVDPNDPNAVPAVVPLAGPTARYTLQGGGFNLNSTNPDAWAAVLRSVRFTAGHEFQYLDTDLTKGTASDAVAPLTVTADAGFLRFSQSAQEVYKTTPGYLHTVSGSTTSFTVHTEYYRIGLHVFDAAGVTLLANKISDLVKAHLTASGPFRSVEEFLSPTIIPALPDDPTSVQTTAPSLLEQAIKDLGYNVDPTSTTTDANGVTTTLDLPFSSVTLTQSDIMTALAPVLFVRSDTFTVRAYGEALNPTTGASEGKAWCEAVVQRLPEPFAPANPNQPSDAEYLTPPGDSGRRFKIISLRWLTKSDI